MKKLLKVLLASAMLLAAGCSSNSSTDTTTEDGSVDLANVKIGVIQLMQHVALDQAYEGFKDVLVEAGVSEDNINYQVPGDQATCSTTADTIVNGGCDLIYCIATPALQAAAAATEDIPIVGCAVTDYESTGLVASNAAPGGNVTGASDLTPVAAQIDLLQELLPDATKVAIMYCGSEDNSIIQGNLAVEACEAANLEYKVYTVTDTSDIQSVTEQVCADGNDVVYIPTDNLLATYMSSVEAVLSEHNIPSIVGEEGMCSEGGLATYGINYYDLGKVAGQQALAILKGEATAATTAIEYLPAEGCALKINKTVADKIGYEIDMDKYGDYVFEME